MTDLHDHLRATFAFAQKTLNQSAEGRKAYYDQKASQSELEVGDEIWYYMFAQPSNKETARKLLPRWAGPYVITDKLSSVVYRIRISKGRKEPTFKWVHRNQIKPYKAPMGNEGDARASARS